MQCDRVTAIGASRLDVDGFRNDRGDAEHVPGAVREPSTFARAYDVLGRGRRERASHPYLAGLRMRKDGLADLHLAQRTKRVLLTDREMARDVGRRRHRARGDEAV